MIAIADLAERFGGDIRLTRQQNFILTGVPDERVDEALRRARRRSASRSTINPVRGNSIACTGEPHCNFSVAETKTRLGALIDGLDERFGNEIADLRLHLDGCPHACAQHWVGDIGFQGTTSRDEGGRRRQAYDIFLRGGLGPGRGDRALAVSARARPTSSTPPSRGSIAGWLAERAAGRELRRLRATGERRRARAALAGPRAGDRITCSDEEEAA